MYTPPVGARRTSSGITHCSDVSFDTKFSERKVPHGSEYSVISRQKVLSARRAGTPVLRAAVRELGCCAEAQLPARTLSRTTLSQWYMERENCRTRLAPYCDDVRRRGNEVRLGKIAEPRRRF